MTVTSGLGNLKMPKLWLFASWDHDNNDSTFGYCNCKSVLDEDDMADSVHVTSQCSPRGVVHNNCPHWATQVHTGPHWSTLVHTGPLVYCTGTKWRPPKTTLSYLSPPTSPSPEQESSSYVPYLTLSPCHNHSCFWNCLTNQRDGYLRGFCLILQYSQLCDIWWWWGVSEKLPFPTTRYMHK